jgi:hypothetical protein
VPNGTSPPPRLPAVPSATSARVRRPVCHAAGVGPDDDDTHRGPVGGRPWAGRRLVAVIVGVALVIAVAGTGLAIATGDDRAEPVVPVGTASGPGTPLPDGMAILSGTVLLGPVVVEGLDDDGQPARWSAVVLVESPDPIAVWSDYVAEIERRASSSDAGRGPDLDPDEAPGCSDRGSASGGDEGVLCTVDVAGLHAELGTVPGDVTGAHLLTLDADPELHAIGTDRDAPTWPGGDAPAPDAARERPDAGEPLAPETVASEGDNDRYVLLEGSELVAQFGRGSVTGGFAVLLRVTSDGDLDQVTDGYVQQATQFEGEDTDPPEVVEYDGTTFTTYIPPGGAGGYSGKVTAVDGPTDDYIVYSLIND